MRGRKPKPSPLKLVTGNPGRRKPRSRKGPRPQRVVPSPPEHLSDRAKFAWGSLSAKLDRLALLTELDGWALERLCETYAEILELQADVAKHGRYREVKTKSGGVMERIRPAALLLGQADNRFRALMGEFGLTPVARERLGIGDGGDEGQDPAEAYFRR